MIGRVENSLKAEKNIELILQKCPDYVEEYYYITSNNRQPKASLEYIRKIYMLLESINKNTKKVKATDITMGRTIRFMNNIQYIENDNGEIRESSISYRKQVHSIIKSFIDFLAEYDFIEDNFMDKIKRPRGRDLVKRDYMSESESKKLLSNAKNIDDGKWMNRNMLMLMILLQTGMRESALVEINIDDIDTINHKITSVVEKGHKMRSYLLTEQIMQYFNKWIIDREKILNGKEEDALFISCHKKRITTAGLSVVVKRYTREILGRELSPHKFRRTFANIMLDKTNGNIYFVQQMLGHSSIDTTQLYLKDEYEKYNKMAMDIISENIFSDIK